MFLIDVAHHHDQLDEDQVRLSLEGLEVRQPAHVGESVSLADPRNPQVKPVRGLRVMQLLFYSGLRFYCTVEYRSVL